MELFGNAKVVRLRSHHEKYLLAEEDQDMVSQDRNGSSKRAKWTVEFIPSSSSSPTQIRFKSCYNSYLTASSIPFLLGMTGKKVLQTRPRNLDSSVEWEPIREGFQVKLKTRYGNFLRANGGVPPWRNSVTHDVPHRSATQDWVLWDVDVVGICDHGVEESAMGSDSCSLSERPSHLEKLESSDLFIYSPPKDDGRTIYYHIADNYGDTDDSGEAVSFIFKGSGVEELTQKLEEEAGVEDIIVCTRSPLNGNLYPLRLHLPPNNAIMHVILVKSSSKDLTNNALKNPRVYIDELINQDEKWVNAVFQKLGIMRKRRKKTDSLLRDVLVVVGHSRKRKKGSSSTRAGEMDCDNLSRKSSFVPRSRRGGPGRIRSSVPETVPEVPRQSGKGKGKVTDEASTAQETKTTLRKRAREQMADDKDEPVGVRRREVELEESAREVVESMATLCGTNLNEASKQVNKALHQVNAWAIAFNKAQKVSSEQLKKAKNRQDVLERDKLQIRANVARDVKAAIANSNQTVGVLEAKLVSKDELLKNNKARFQAQYAEECDVTTAMKKFIDGLGYDPETFEPYPPKLKSLLSKMLHR